MTQRAIAIIEDTLKMLTMLSLVRIDQFKLLKRQAYFSLAAGFYNNVSKYRFDNPMDTFESAT